MTQFINKGQRKVCEIICEGLENIDKKLKELKELAELSNIPFEVIVYDRDDNELFSKNNEGRWYASNMYNC